MGLGLGTWLALGAACTCTTAAVSASTVLYRGTLFNEEGANSFLIRFFLRRKGLDEQGEPLQAKASRGMDGGKVGGRGRQTTSIPCGFQPSEAGAIDPVLRRRAVPTALKALGISTAMAATVGAAGAALLYYSTQGDGSGDGEEGERDLRQILDDSFKGRASRGG